MADFKFMAKMTRQTKHNYKCIWQNWKLHNCLGGKQITIQYHFVLKGLCKGTVHLQIKRIST